MNRQPLKGLFIFAFFSAKGHLIMASILMLFASIVMLLIGSTPMVGFSSMTIFPTLSLLTSASEAKVEKHKWDKFQLSMPIRRKDVITSRYLFFLFLTLIALAIIGLVEGIAHLLETLSIIEIGSFNLGGIGPIIEIIDAFAMSTGQLSLGITLISTGTAFLSCAIYYPLLYTICRDKEELTSILTLIGHLIVTFFIMWLGARLEFSLNQLVILSFVVPTVLLVVSYVFTVRVYQKLDV